jgi:hypothetical protein
MNWFFLPAWLVAFFAFIGLSVISQGVFIILRLVINYFLFKEPYRNEKEARYFLLLEENRNLKEKLSDLEQENNQILQSIIKQIQDKL